MNPTKNNDYDGVFKALIEEYPADFLRLVCNADIPDGVATLDGPTEQPKQRSRQKDKVVLVPAGGGRRAQVYLLEIQVKRTADFEERMVSYWASAALKYPRHTHEIHQVAIWPRGNGYDVPFERDGQTLRYLRVNVPDDLDTEAVLNSPVAPLALFASKPAPEVIDRVADRIAATTQKEHRLILADLGILAGVSLGAQLIEALWSRGMNFDHLKGTHFGESFLAEGREEGRREAKVETIASVLRQQYGELADLDTLARDLVADGYDANLARIVARVPIEELRAVAHVSAA